MKILSKLERRVIDISYKHHLSHLSSCLTAVQLIDNIYKVKRENDIFILSSGHAGLALYCVLEKLYFKDAEKLFEKHGVHPNRDVGDGIYCSSGSLGSAITLAVGMAICDRTRDVYVLMSDGECAEGSVWEALRIAGDLRLENLKIMVNGNGSGAYGKIDLDALDVRLNAFYPVLLARTQLFKFPHWLQGFDGHYVTLDKAKYKEVTTEG